MRRALDGFGLAAFIARSIVGGIAQLVERFVRNEEARGSNPLTSTPLIIKGLERLGSVSKN